MGTGHGTTIGDEGLEALRVAAVEQLNLLDTPGEERFDRITRIAKEIFGVPIAEINLIDDHRQFTKSPQPGGVAGNIPLDDSFCDVTVHQPEIIVVPDATQDARFSSRSAVSDERHVRFYVGRPLSIDHENRVGTLCLVDTTPREFSDDQRRLFDELGDWVERELQDTADLDRAAEWQQKLLPRTQPSWPDYDVAGVCLPAKTVAGDYYAWHGSDDSIELTLADVMGKGTSGAIIAATVRAAFQSRTGLDVVEAVTQVDRQLAGDLGDTGSFATLFHAKLDIGSGRVEFADAGHGLSLIVRADGSSERLPATGLPIGILKDGAWTRGHATLEPGDRLITFTDGLLDLFDGTLDSLDRVAELVADAAEPKAAIAAISALVADGSADDDVTAVVIARQP